MNNRDGRVTRLHELQPRAVDGLPPPQDLLAEERVLGASLAFPEFAHDVFPPLTVEHFFSERHRRIAEAIIHVVQRDGRVDQIAVYEYLRERERLEQIGGAAVLEDLQVRVQGPRDVSDAKSAVNLVWNAYHRRQLSLLCQQAQAAAYLPGLTTRELFSEFEVNVAKLCRVAARSNDAVHGSEVMAGIVARITRNEIPIMIPSGLLAYDMAVDMMRTKEVHLVGAPSGVGKTSFGVGAMVAAARAGMGVLYVCTADMTREMIGQRVLARESSVPTKLIRNYGALDLFHRHKVFAAADAVRGLPFHIEAEPYKQSVASIRAQVRRLKATMAVKGTALRLIVIDYVQELSIEEQRGKTSAQGLVDAITELHDMAIELDVGVLGLFQLTFDAKRPTDWLPDTGDIADSKGIVKPADTVTFIHQPRLAKGERSTPRREVLLLTRKGRNSGQSRRHAIFDGPIGRFEDGERYEEDE